MLNIKYFFFNPYQERCMVIWDGSQKAVILDPGFFNTVEQDRLFSFIRGEGLEIEAILLTHAHFDHIYGVAACVKEFGVDVYMSPDDKVVKDNIGIFAGESGMPVPDTGWDTVDVRDGDTIRFGDMVFEVISTPGHSPGSVCYYSASSKDLFCGDTLFAGAIGRTDFRWGSYDDEIRSIMNKIMGMDSDVRVHPCHGGGTTIGYERTHNPFLQPFNEKDPETGAVDGIEFNG